MLEWDPPATPNGVITNYSVTWSPDAASEPIITTETTYTLTNLQPCTNYTVSITATTNKGLGPPGDTSQTTLPKGNIYILLLFLTRGCDKNVEDMLSCKVKQYKRKHSKFLLFVL